MTTKPPASHHVTLNAQTVFLDGGLNQR